MAKSAFSPNNGRMVEGPLAGSSTDNAIVRWDSTTGRVLQNSGADTVITDAGLMNLSVGLAVELGNTYTQSSPAIQARTGFKQNALEWGHANQSGYGNNLAVGAGNGQALICLHCEGGTNNNTIRTRGNYGYVISLPANNALTVGRTTSNALDNQTVPIDWSFETNGDFTVESGSIIAAGAVINGAATNPMVDVTQPSSGYIGILVSGAVGAELTQPLIRGRGYSPAFELLDKDGVQNWHFGIDDNDTNALNIGRGACPGQGITPAIKIATTDVVTLSNNLALGSGKGIDFSATGDAAGMTSELLDDYEEGSFTPTLTRASSASSHSYGTQTGYYVKIGRRVFFNALVASSSNTGGSGINVMAGLPYTNNGTATYAQAVSVSFNDMFSATNAQSGQVQSGATTIYFTPTGPTSGYIGEAWRNTGTHYLSVSGHYDAA